MNHSVSTSSFTGQDSPASTISDCAPMPQSPDGAELEPDAHTYVVVYAVDNHGGGLWEVQAVAASVADAERSVKYWAQIRNDSPCHIIAIVLVETLR